MTKEDRENSLIKGKATLGTLKEQEAGKSTKLLVPCSDHANHSPLKDLPFNVVIEEDEYHMTFILSPYDYGSNSIVEASGIERVRAKAHSSSTYPGLLVSNFKTCSSSIPNIFSLSGQKCLPSLVRVVLFLS
ncbi:hypothetical protein ACFE04_011179 [Oxalis oulophora]